MLPKTLIRIVYVFYYCKITKQMYWINFHCLSISSSSSCRATIWISLTLSRHPSLLSIASSRSSRLYPVSPRSCFVSVQAGRPNFTHLCEGVKRSMSLMSSSLLLQQCPSCLVHLTSIVFVMGGKWLYSCCFVGCYLQDLFNIAHSILV